MVSFQKRSFKPGIVGGGSGLAFMVSVSKCAGIHVGMILNIYVSRHRTLVGFTEVDLRPSSIQDGQRLQLADMLFCFGEVTGFALGQ